MRVGILGGSFNPPHNGHLYISKISHRYLNLNKIWWFPTILNPFKNKCNYYSFDKRILLCRNISKNYRYIDIYEYNYSYAINLVKYLNNRYPQIKFKWIMGDDNLQYLHKWYRYDEFLNLIDIAVLNRYGYIKFISKYPSWHSIKKKNFTLIRNRKTIISSTQIRKKNV